MKFFLALAVKEIASRFCRHAKDTCARGGGNPLCEIEKAFLPSQVGTDQDLLVNDQNKNFQQKQVKVHFRPRICPKNTEFCFLAEISAKNIKNQ